MKTLLTLTLAGGLVLAGAASAEPRVSDAVYIAAARCEGLAKGSGQADPALTRYVKDAERLRSPAVRDRGDQAFMEGKRAGARNKAKAGEDLAGACQAFRADSQTAAN